MKQRYLTESNIQDVTSGIINKCFDVHNRKHKVEFEKNRVALIVVDMQNYFLSPDSPAFIPSAEAITDNINKLIEAFDSSNQPVIFTRHSNTHDNAGMMAVWWSRLLSADSNYFPISDKIDYSDRFVTIDKHQYDAFYQTKLEDILLSANINTLVITGVMTNLCVETTARTAFIRNFQVVLPADATAAYNLEFHEASLLNLSYMASEICSTNDLIGRLNYN